jgi:hypothetical protein
MFVYGAVGPLLPVGGWRHTVGIGGALSAHYLDNLVAPTDLAVSYPVLACGGDACTPFAVEGGLRGAGLLLLTICAAGGVFGIARFGRREEWARSAFALCGFAVVLTAIVLVIGRHEPGADRHAYPLVALFGLLIADLSDRLARGTHVAGRSVFVATACVTIFASAQLAHARVGTWRDERTLWTTAAAEAPLSARVHYNLAVLSAEDESFSEARRRLRRAIAIDPGYVAAYLAQARIACIESRPQWARRSLDAATAAGADWRDVRAIESNCRVTERE